MSLHQDGLLGQKWLPADPDSKLSSLARITKNCAGYLRPSFLTRPGRSKTKTQLGRTAYLDGLRGFAAFLVYWQHHQLWAHGALGPDKILENAFGYDNQYYFACLPFIRTFLTGGHFAVTVFFVISGYVLSAKPLALIQGGEYGRLGDTLASALFRRWMRLYIPVIVTTFLYMTSWHALGIWTDSDHQGTYGDELIKWYRDLKNFTFIFDGSGDPFFHYNGHVWSIPVEFKGSIVIYTSLLAFSRCRKNARLWCELGMIYYCMYIVDGSFFSMFLAGMLLCDLDLLAAKGELPRFFALFEPWKELVFFNLFIISLYLGGVPSNSADISVLRASSGWYYLSFLKPQAVFNYKWFYLFFASVSMVASVPQVPWLKTFFEMRFNLYLGRISYAFYLIHGPVMWTLGDRLYVAVGWYRDAHLRGVPGWVNLLPLPKAGPFFGFEFSFLVPHIIILPVTLWLAEVVTKTVDKPTVRFVQWAYAKTLAPVPVKL
ncbi:hypothetical protein GMDG_07066 [Pseudogymnoascus destructans 20631-21]|uniref:Acyltransferase 3 domain-containing protein n=2 Tax=Pseudogymnoascus destructans TaxID=655981 RepID=L8FYP5_PSED2|nr:hypothetical protein GMDG_07066 [Pseudogymnoascus destructans 20631-21]